MSLSAAGTLAQMLPALLVLGLLGPLLQGWRVQSPERFYFASQTIGVLIVEGGLLYFITRDQAPPAGWSIAVQLAVLWPLSGIAVFVLAWAKRLAKERAEEHAEWESWKENFRAKRKRATPDDEDSDDK